MARTPYPSDAKDDEWEFVAPYLALIHGTKRTAKTVQKATGHSVGIAYVDQGCTGDQAQDDAEHAALMAGVCCTP